MTNGWTEKRTRTCGARPFRRRRRRRQRRKRVILAGGMVAIGTKKMSAKNAQSIEEHTGVSPEELETLILKKPFGPASCHLRVRLGV